MLKYTSILKSRSYLYLELKKAAQLTNQGLPIGDIKHKSLEENIFLVNTDSRKREIASTIINRLKVLDDYLINEIANGNLQSSKQLALYSIMKTDRLFFEFMTEVYKEKVFLNDLIITDKDFNVFFRGKSEQSKKIAGWKDYTIYKLKQVYKRILSEAGFITNKGDRLEILPQIMEPSLMDHLKTIGDQSYIRAMLGEV